MLAEINPRQSRRRGERDPLLQHRGRTIAGLREATALHMSALRRLSVLHPYG